MNRFRAVTVLLIAVSALGLVACGSSSNSSSGSGSTAATSVTSGSTSSSFNDGDVAFAQSMIPHHEQAIEMADMALDPAVKASPAVTALAKRIKAAQDPEIAQMKQWLADWSKPAQMDMSGGHDMASMNGMMSSTDMSSLSKATGPAFDRMWLDMMVRHHQGAIAMATTVKSVGQNPDAAKLADAIITGQQREIDEMKVLLGK